MVAQFFSSTNGALFNDRLPAAVYGTSLLAGALAERWRPTRGAPEPFHWLAGATSRLMPVECVPPPLSCCLWSLGMAGGCGDGGSFYASLAVMWLLGWGWRWGWGRGWRRRHLVRVWPLVRILCASCFFRSFIYLCTWCSWSMGKITVSKEYGIITYYGSSCHEPTRRGPPTDPRHVEKQETSSPGHPRLSAQRHLADCQKSDPHENKTLYTNPLGKTIAYLTLLKA